MHKHFIVWSMEESQALEYSKCSWGLKLRLDSTVNKRISLHTPYDQTKKYYFYQKITKMQLFDLKFAILNRYAFESTKIKNDKFRTKTKVCFFLHTLRFVKYWHQPEILKINIFDLKYTNHNKYVVESPEILIRKLSSIRIERENCLKLSKHAKHMFLDQKMHVFTQISEHSTHTHLNHSEFDSGVNIT